ncbi:MAG TPA: hypothetical protein DEA08_07425, partial [Planctomycetes bacterium]|nr:hypothetical protein [Planctomycetota bacterium]
GAIARLQRDAEATLEAYERGRAAAQETVYGATRREGKLLGSSPATTWRWNLLGARDDALDAPLAGRDDWIAQRGRKSARQLFRARFQGASEHRLQAYDDELELLGALEQVLPAGSAARRELLAASQKR